MRKNQTIKKQWMILKKEERGKGNKNKNRKWENIYNKK